MVRPREFDRDAALERALRVFWANGFAATSTDELLKAMRIGRQSLYNTFGDKSALYREALNRYQQRLVAGHLERLDAPRAALDGIHALLDGLIPERADERVLGCMGVNSVSEFGTSDEELTGMRNAMSRRLHKRLVERIEEGQAAGAIDRALDSSVAAQAIQVAMTGIQVAARSGASAAELRRIARFTTDGLRRR